MARNTLWLIYVIISSDALTVMLFVSVLNLLNVDELIYCFDWWFIKLILLVVVLDCLYDCFGDLLVWFSHFIYIVHSFRYQYCFLPNFTDICHHFLQASVTSVMTYWCWAREYLGLMLRHVCPRAFIFLLYFGRVTRRMRKKEIIILTFVSRKKNKIRNVRKRR